MAESRTKPAEPSEYKKPGAAPEAGPGVMHVITGLGDGGAEAVLTRLVLAQRAAPLAQRVVSLTGGGRYDAELRDAGIPTESLGMRAGRPGPGGLLRLARLIRRHRPGVIQSWMYHADLAALIALALSGRRGQTRLYWGIRAANMALEHYGPLLGATIRACAWLSPYPDAVVANSRAGLAHHLERGFRPRRGLIIRNGIDCARFRPMPEQRAAMRAKLGIPEDRPVAAHVARLDPMKDHATLMAALARAPDVTCLAVGQGTESLTGHDNLVALGRRDDVRPVLAAADMIVSSSIGEGFPNALAEGMAMGLPAIATEVGDTAELMGPAGGPAGVLVPPSDPEALAAGLSALAADPERRRQLGALARTRVAETFSLEAMVRAFDELHRTGGGSGD